MGLRFRSEGLSYDDVLLVPKLGIVDSRKDVDLSTQLTRGIRIDVPIVAAPMTSVTEWKMARAMIENGAYAYIHRFMSISEQQEQWGAALVRGIRSAEPAGCALGIDEGMERLESLLEVGCRSFCIDIAHAHCLKMEKFVDSIPSWIRERINLVIGNVGTPEGAIFLQELDVDAIKVGIGPGAVCSTREVTGFGMPQLSAIAEIASAVNVPIIADGGIKTSGDIVKALAAGASSVMVGRLLAGTDEAAIPGEYFGMASKRMNGHHAPEGVEGTVDRVGSVEDVLKSLTWGIRSGVSYGGGRNIQELQENAEFVQVGYGAHIETATRI